MPSSTSPAAIVPRGDAPAPVHPSSTRRSRWVVSAVVVVVAAVVAVLAAGRDGGRRDAVTYVTEAAQVVDLAESVEGTGAVEVGAAGDAAIAADLDGVVTAAPVSVGDTLAGLDAVVEVNGRTRHVLPAADPLYRPLAEGVEGSDVQALEEALQAAGLDPGEVDEVFTADTTQALADWQDDAGLPATGVADASWLSWVPEGAEVVAVPVEVATRVAAGDLLVVTARPGDFRVRVALDQADVVTVAVDDRSTITLDGIAGSIDGRVGSVARTPTAAGSAAYDVVVDADDWPSSARPGMSATVEIVVDVVEDAVVVPTGVIGGTAKAPTVPVLVDGEVRDQPVDLGLVTATHTEVVGGLEPGTPVVLGEES